MVMILTSLPSADQRGDLLARRAHDAGVEAARQTAIRRRHDDQMALVLAGAGQQQRRGGAGDAGRQVGDDAAMRWA